MIIFPLGVGKSASTGETNFNEVSIAGSDIAVSSITSLLSDVPKLWRRVSRK